MGRVVKSRIDDGEEKEKEKTKLWNLKESGENPNNLPFVTGARDTVGGQRTTTLHHIDFPSFRSFNEGLECLEFGNVVATLCQWPLHSYIEICGNPGNLFQAPKSVHPNQTHREEKTSFFPHFSRLRLSSSVVRCFPLGLFLDSDFGHRADM